MSDIAAGANPEKINAILNMMLDLIATSQEATFEFLKSLQNQDYSTANTLIQDLLDANNSVKSVYPQVENNIKKAFADKMIENIRDTLSEIKEKLSSNDLDSAWKLAEFQLLPFLSLLWEDIYFWGTIYPDKQKMDAYYRDEFVEHYQNPYVKSGETKYEVSILVAAYNHLDKTKECIESILQHTDFEKLNCELILIDHGSSDGTLEYFKTLPADKIIHFKENVRIGMFALAFQVCESKYYAFVSNDTIVTPNWLEILLTALKSDSKIISVTPATPNTSNLQSLHIPNMDKKQFLDFAEKNNISNPKKWYDRSRIMPVIAVNNIENMNKVAYADPYFYTLEYWDDDFSLRAKRAGLRQLLCEDVFCYHYGSETGKEIQKTENTLVSGKELFKFKNGIDPWGNGFCYDYIATELLFKETSSKKQVNVLGIDCGLGDTLLQIRSVLRNCDIETNIIAVSTDASYEKDLTAVSDTFALLNQAEIDSDLRNLKPEMKFDFIYLSLRLENYKNYQKLLQEISKRMDIGGKFIFSVSNPYHAMTLYQLLNFSLPEKDEPISFIPYNILAGRTRSIFSNVEIISVTSEPNGLDSFIRSYFKNFPNKNELKNRLIAESYYFLCTK